MAGRYAVTLSSRDSGQPLFCLHPVFGEVSLMRWFFRTVALDRPVIGLRAFGLDRECEPLIEVPAMAERFIAIIRQIQPVGPYSLFGYCFGGDVAHEIASQLVACGEEVAFLGLLGLPSVSAPLLAQGPEAVRADRLAVMAHVCESAGIEMNVADHESPEFLAEVLRGWTELGRLARDATVADLEALLEVATQNIFAMDRYERPKLSVSADVFLPPDNGAADDEASLDDWYISYRAHRINVGREAWMCSSKLASLVHDAFEARNSFTPPGGMGPLTSPRGAAEHRP